MSVWGPHAKAEGLGSRPCWGPKGRGKEAVCWGTSSNGCTHRWSLGYRAPWHQVWVGGKAQATSPLWAVPITVALDGFNVAQTHLGSMGRKGAEDGDGGNGAAGLCAGRRWGAVRGCRVSLACDLGLGTHSCIPTLDKQQLLPLTPRDGGTASNPNGLQRKQGGLWGALQPTVLCCPPPVPVSQRTPSA